MGNRNLGWDGKPINVGDEVYDVMEGWHGRVMSVGEYSAKVIVDLYECIGTPTILLTHKDLKLFNSFRDLHKGAHSWVEQLGKDQCNDRKKVPQCMTYQKFCNAVFI